MLTWREEVITILEKLGGHAYLKEIYEEYSKNGLRKNTLHFDASIRDALEKGSIDSKKYDGNGAVFVMLDGKNAGHYGLINELNCYVDLTTNDDQFSEGKQFLRKHLIRERNKSLISLAKKDFKKKHNNRLYCEVCGFDFSKNYGKLGEDFIEAHHIKPVSEMQDGEKTKLEDIVMLCSNCHSMVHRKRPWLTKEELKSIISKN